MTPSAHLHPENDPNRTDFGGTSHIATLSDDIRQFAFRLGFDHCRFAPVALAQHAEFFERWLAAGFAADMEYLHRNVDKRRDPLLLTDRESAPYQSIIVLAVDYHHFDLPPSLRDDPSHGVIASYAWSDDYHEIIRPLLHEMDGYIRSWTGRSTPGKCLIDTGPVLERDWAQQSGIGFTGKNCCTIRPRVGSWLFLATVMVPEKLEYDSPPTSLEAHHAPSGQEAPDAKRMLEEGLPFEIEFGAWRIEANRATGLSSEPATATGSCGRCTRCLSACPTDAFTGPYTLDARRCISYWTIEAQGPIPYELRSRFGNRIFGCDICQEVCPWNAHLPERAPLIDELQATRERMAPPLLEGFQPSSPYWLEEDAFQRQFERSPILRSKRSGMLRNVCIALGNWGDPQAIPALTRALADVEPLARGHAAWALAQAEMKHPETSTAQILASFGVHERNDWVRTEIARALRLCAIT